MAIALLLKKIRRFFTVKLGQEETLNSKIEKDLPMSDDVNATDTYILFELAGTTYGLPSKVVQLLEMVERITPVPEAAYFVEGVVFSRGQVIPAIDLRTRFGFEKIAYTARSRLIVVRSEERTVGLIADTAREFLSIPREKIQPPPDTISGLSGHYLEGIATLGNRLVLILNVAELLNAKHAVSDAPTNA